MIENSPHSAEDLGPVPGQETKIPPCHRATKPAGCNYKAHMPQLESVLQRKITHDTKKILHAATNMQCSQ